MTRDASSQTPASETNDQSVQPHWIEVTGFPAPKGASPIWLDHGPVKVRMICIQPHEPTQTKGSVLLCTGYNEAIEKYFEVAQNLVDRGYGVAMFEWPGQGASGRFLPDPRFAHIENFGFNVDAQVKGYEVLTTNFHGPYFILAHSMGGAISTESMRRGVITPDAAVLCAPMLGLKLNGPTKILARLLRLVGLGKKPVKIDEGPDQFVGNILTNDKRRWEMNQNLYVQRPEYRLATPTFGWVNAALDLYKTWRKPKAFHNFKVPTLVASAGSEKLVSNSAQNEVTRLMGGSAKLISIDGANHEILMETDDKRDQLLQAIDDHFSAARTS